VAGEADLAGQLLDDVLQDGALASLGLQRLGDLDIKQYFRKLTFSEVAFF